MTLELSLEEIIELLDGRLAVGMMSDSVGPVVSDTRNGVDGAWFLCLEGKEYDGHDFIGEAFSSGALGCIVKERSAYPIASTGFPLVAVDDTRRAYGRLARNWTRRLGFKVILLASEDRECSSLLAESLFKSVKEGSDCQLIDTRMVKLDDCFADILLMDEGLQCLVVNLVPGNCIDAMALVESLPASLVCAIGVPFGYLRLFEDAGDIDSVNEAMFESLCKSRGLFLWASTHDMPDRFFCDGGPIRRYTDFIKTENHSEDQDQSRLLTWCQEEILDYLKCY